MSQLLFDLFLFTFIQLGLCAVILHYYWRRYRKAGRKFRYGLSDMLAAMVGLMPSVIVAAWLIIAVTSSPDFARNMNLVFGLFLLVLMVSAQATGMIVGRLRRVLRGEGDSKGGWASALSVLIGALLGALCLSIALPAYLFILGRLA